MNLQNSPGENARVHLLRRLWQALAFPLLIVAVTCAAAWYYAPQSMPYTFVIAGLGLLLDIVSCAQVIAYRQSPYRLPIGHNSLLFYGWFVLASPESVSGAHDGSATSIIIGKGFDIVGLCILHFLIQAPAIVATRKST